MQGIPLGSRVRDRLTSFEGIVVGRTEWLYGCVRVGVQPAQLHEGKPIEPHWLDEAQVEVIDETVHQLAAPVPLAAVGGPDRPHGGRQVTR